jgi:hypothetical protein
MSVLRDLWDRNNKTSQDLEIENLNRKKNDTVLDTANKISTFIKRFQNFTTEFENLDELIIDDNYQYYFKQWQIQVFEADDVELNYMLDSIAANIFYTVIYDETTENNLGYYNLGNELRQIDFFSIEGNILYFNVAVYISKAFGGEEITNPQAKLEIIIKPFLTVNQ